MEAARDVAGAGGAMGVIARRRRSAARPRDGTEVYASELRFGSPKTAQDCAVVVALIGRCPARLVAPAPNQIEGGATVVTEDRRQGPGAP